MAPGVARELSLGGNAMRAITPLVEAGILTELTGQGRNRMWQAAEVLTALDAVGARAGRRGGGWRSTTTGGVAAATRQPPP